MFRYLEADEPSESEQLGVVLTAYPASKHHKGRGQHKDQAHSAASNAAREVISHCIAP